MSFSQATITSVAPPVYTPTYVQISWTSSSPAGTWFQVYFNLQLVWDGTTTTAKIPLPTTLSSVDIGTVDPGEQTTSFAADIAGQNVFAELEWMGGTFESPEISGFYVYQSAAAGGAISYTTPVATIAAYPQSIYTDGFGVGGFGDGGFGESASTYSWTSGSLAGGLWNFAVKAFDTAGNLSTAQTCQVQIEAPPLPPALYPDNTRLHYVFNATTEEATLNWSASPSA